MVTPRHQNSPSEPLLDGNRAGHADAEAYCVLFSPTALPESSPNSSAGRTGAIALASKAIAPQLGGAMGSRFSAICSELRPLRPSPLPAEGLYDPWATAPDPVRPAELSDYPSGGAVGLKT